MDFLNTFRRKDAVNINDPSFLEVIRHGTTRSVSSDTALRITSVYTCVKILAESIASMPCSLYKIDGDSRTIQRDHRMHKMVARSPNDFMTATEFWQFVMASLLLQGEAFALIIRTAKGPFELLPLTTDMVGVHVEGRKITYSVTWGDQDGDTNTDYFSQRNVLHLKHMPLDGVRGTSPVEYNAALLGYTKDARDFSQNVFTNGATPRGVLSTEGELSDEAYERVKASWTASHGGVGNSNKVAILEGGLSFSKMEMSPADIKLLEQFKWSQTEIAGFFRVPPHMMGNLERATNNNIEHQGLDFYTNTLLPWTTLIENRLNFQLLDTSTQEFSFDNSKVVKGTFADQVEAYGKGLTLGIWSPNEVRQKLGDNPREGGDEFVSQSNNLTFGDEQETDDGNAEEGD